MLHKFISISLLLICGLSVNCFAGIPDSKIVAAIVGEAEGLSIYEQSAIGQAILNRGSLHGVFGYQRASKHVLGQKTRQKALNALNMARQKDVVHGGTHWLSKWDLAHCRPSLIAWRNRMVITLKTDHFTFYREA